MLFSKPRLPIRDIILVGLLPSPLKKLVYRLKGYRIGRGVSLGLGSVIIGEHVTLGDETQIGFLTIIRGTTIEIEAHVQIGAMTFLDTPHIKLGEGTKINEQVFVGGLNFPDSRFFVGRNCQIMQMCFINPVRSITIGDDTGIGGDSLLFGHNSWLSKFEGYPVEFDSIEIGNSVSISWRVFILPGSKIGDGTVIGANSLVRGTIPGRCLAVGFPARVVSRAPEFPLTLGPVEKETMLREIFEEMLGYFRGFGLDCQPAGASWIVTKTIRRFWSSPVSTWRLAVNTDSPTTMAVAPDTDVFLSLWRIPAPLRHALDRRKATWIDIECKERSDHGNDLGEEVMLFLRRYGVRFQRCRVDHTAPTDPERAN